jgi:hypothetical protein
LTLEMGERNDGRYEQHQNLSTAFIAGFSEKL